MAFFDSLPNTLSDLGAFSNPFGAPSAGKWNLSKGVYTSSTNEQIVIFYEETNSPPLKAGGGVGLAQSDVLGETVLSKTAIDTLSDSGGKRLAIYEYPYLSGQRLKNLGRKGETYTFNIKFFGNNHQQKFQDFIRIVVNDTDTGTLLHPVLSAIRGALKVQLSTYEFIHRHDEWNSVTIRAVFIEDNTAAFQFKDLDTASSDSALRTLLQDLVDTQAAISSFISDVTAVLNLPAAIEASLKAKLSSVVNQVSGLLGQLASTFSSNAQLKSLAAQASTASTSVAGITSGTVTQSTSGGTTLAKLPPVFQVGFDPQTQASIEAQANSFINANQITPQQAVFSANQARANITSAIAEIETTFGNEGAEIVYQYRSLSVSIQQGVESSIASAQPLVKIYTVPVAMSLRMVAFNNGLSADRQNDLEALNPYLGSVNYVPKGTQVTVPVQ